MKCSRCGSSNRESQKFCTNCGMPLHTGKETGRSARTARPVSSGSPVILRISAGILGFICVIAVLRTLYVFPNLVNSFRFGVLSVLSATLRLLLFFGIVLLAFSLFFFAISCRAGNIPTCFSLVAAAGMLIPALYLLWMLFQIVSFAVYGQTPYWGPMLLRFLFPYLLGPLLVIIIMFALTCVFDQNPLRRGLSGIFSDVLNFFTGLGAGGGKSMADRSQNQNLRQNRSSQYARDAARRRADWEASQSDPFSGSGYSGSGNGGYDDYDNYEDDYDDRRGYGGRYDGGGRGDGYGGGRGGYNAAYGPESLPEEYRPISMWGYFGYELLFAIPLVGFILLLVFSFGGTRNVNLRNFARSYFCALLVGLILSVIMFTILASTGSLAYFMYQFR